MTEPTDAGPERLRKLRAYAGAWDHGHVLTQDARLLFDVLEDAAQDAHVFGYLADPPHPLGSWRDCSRQPCSGRRWRLGLSSGGKGEGEAS